MKKILIILAHPTLETSNTNDFLYKSVKCADFVTEHNLYDVYPDFVIDVEAEQDLLKEHDIIVLQHPLYWFSVPALLKEWFDYTLEPNWIFKNSTSILQGKKILQVITTGAGEAAFSQDGIYNHDLNTFLKPIEFTARYCQLEYLEPLILYETSKVDEQMLTEFSARYYKRLYDLSREKD